MGIFPFTQAARRLGIRAVEFLPACAAHPTYGIAVLAAFMELPSLVHGTFQHGAGSGLSGIIGFLYRGRPIFGFAMYAVLGARLGGVLTTFAPGRSTGPRHVDRGRTR